MDITKNPHKYVLMQQISNIMFTFLVSFLLYFSKFLKHNLKKKFLACIRLKLFSKILNMIYVHMHIKSFIWISLTHKQKKIDFVFYFVSKIGKKF
jgi:hypothetical protein